MSGKTMIFLPLRELRRSDVSQDLPPVASHRYWGIMAEQMMAVFSDSTSTKRGCFVDQVQVLSLPGRAGSESRDLIPEGPQNGVQKGYLGSKSPKMIPQGLREGHR